MKFNFAVTTARSECTQLVCVHSHQAATGRWTHIEVDIGGEFDFEDEAQCRELLRRLRSAHNLFFERKGEIAPQ